MSRRTTSLIEELDRDILDPLHKIGFRTNLGYDGTGLFPLVLNKCGGYYFGMLNFFFNVYEFSRPVLQILERASWSAKERLNWRTIAKYHTLPKGALYLTTGLSSKPTLLYLQPGKDIIYTAVTPSWDWLVRQTWRNQAKSRQYFVCIKWVSERNPGRENQTNLGCQLRGRAQWTVYV